MEPDWIIIVSHAGADRSISVQGLKEYRVYSRICLYYFSTVQNDDSKMMAIFD